MMSVKELHDAFERKLVSYAEDVRREKAKELAMKADAFANGSMMPNNYWLLRHKAEARFNAAMLMLEALDEAVKA